MVTYNFWELCKVARKAKGFTITQISKETGYTHQNISAFETGKMLRVNMDILLWYIRNTDILDMVRAYESEGSIAEI